MMRENYKIYNKSILQCAIEQLTYSAE